MILNHNIVKAKANSMAGNLPSVRINQMCEQFNAKVADNRKLGWIRHSYSFSIYDLTTKVRLVDNKSGGEALQFMQGIIWWQDQQEEMANEG